MTDEVLYEEIDGIAIVAINRPEKKNTLTEGVVRGIADGIDAASRSKEVAAIVLRGVGDTFTAGYDLNAGRRGRAGGVPTTRRDLAPREGRLGPRARPRSSWAHNVRALHEDLALPEARDRPDPRASPIGGATDLVLCCDQLCTWPKRRVHRLRAERASTARRPP